MSLSKKADEVFYGGQHVHIGCDPELFIATDEGVVGSERLIPKEGIPATQNFRTLPGIVRDGVQIELHPAPSTCRQSLAGHLRSLMVNLHANLQKEAGKYKASFAPVVKVSKKEMDQLSEDARKLGCMPSSNTHRPMATVRVTKSNERMRCAGGHIHLGVGNLRDGKGEARNPERVKLLVDLFDVLVGLPCVLMDRDPGQRIRRRVYGRAGEYRLNAHGIEYRTPSNFWLRHYYLFHLVTGQMRNAYGIWCVNNNAYKFADELLKLVDMKKVEKAINRNDFDLAMECWLPVADWLEEHSCSGTGLASGSKENFLFFVNQIKEKGIESWFPDEPLAAWVGNLNQTYGGWESYCAGHIAAQRRAAEKELAKVAATPTEPFPTSAYAKKEAA